MKENRKFHNASLDLLRSRCLMLAESPGWAGPRAEEHKHFILI
jgi:hypothetical protein